MLAYDNTSWRRNLGPSHDESVWAFPTKDGLKGEGTGIDSSVCCFSMISPSWLTTIKTLQYDKEHNAYVMVCWCLLCFVFEGKRLEPQYLHYLGWWHILLSVMSGWIVLKSHQPKTRNLEGSTAQRRCFPLSDVAMFPPKERCIWA